MRRIHHHLNVRSWALACAVLVAVAVAGGCSGDSGENKAGSESAAKPVELVLANHEGSAENVGEWARAVERLSGGSVRIRISNNWRQGESNYEKAVLDDVRRGKVPLASVMSRAFDEVGVTSFQPLAAPFLVDSAELEQRVLKSEVAERALAGTEEIGVVGLALMPGDLRRPIGLSQPLAAPDDYRGARVYTREGKVAAATLEALGAQPAHGPSDAWSAKVDGAEVGLRAVRGQPEIVRARITSNVVFWAQPSTIVMNEDAFEGLSDDQQRALRKAAADVLDEQSRVFSALQGEDLQAVCRTGAKLVEATPSQLAGLAAAVEPVYRMIERSPGNAEAVAKIRELKGGAKPDTVDCRGTSKQASDGQTSATELEGTFRTTLTEDELANSPLLHDAGEVNDENWGELTLKLSDGRVDYTIENNRADWEASGTYTTDGDAIKLQLDEIGETWGFRWSLYRGTLKLERDKTLGVPPELHAPTPLLVHAWERIG